MQSAKPYQSPDDEKRSRVMRLNSESLERLRRRFSGRVVEVWDCGKIVRVELSTHVPYDKPTI